MGARSKVAFIHPDLGIGGAEKSMLDAASALKNSNYECRFFASHHDPSHCFPESLEFKVTVVGDWLPRSVFGRFYALFAYLRMIYTAIYLVFFSDFSFDVLFCDQISACIPILRLSGKPVIFYCHFPDMLLTDRKSFLKRLYRYPIDWLEQVTTGQANTVLVNSKFTAGVFKDTFKRLSHINPRICYPIPNFAALDQPIDSVNQDWSLPDLDVTFLSINRYERKKNLGLAIQALDALQKTMKSLKGKAHLIMAGGYDERVAENREYYLELRKLACDLGLDDHVTFLRSFSDSEKRVLLSLATCLVYTPDREHFGIVPVEAMYMKCPVLAVNSGGPLETVEHAVTGFLSSQTPADFSNYMAKFIHNKSLSDTMGEAGKERMVRLFSYDTYAKDLSNAVQELIDSKFI